jgi:2-amino-4-hydroxy-6-hydroxymethyldihydropteridine diphosphokinase
MQVYLGIGSNLGDRQANIEKALKLLNERLQIELVSSIYETKPMGYVEQPKFLNAVCRGQTELGPLQLLSLVKGIEASLGRVSSFPNAPRTIDLDIIFYGDMIMQTPELTIPHPRLEKRAFVLIPLLEIAPDLSHPVSGESVKDLTARVQRREGIKKIGKLGVGDL